MKEILLKRLERLKRMEEIANHAESDYEREPENTEFEETFDRAYKNEYDAYISLAKYIEYMTGGAVDFMKAKELIQTKRAELLQLLA